MTTHIINTAGWHFEYTVQRSPSDQAEWFFAILFCYGAIAFAVLSSMLAARGPRHTTEAPPDDTPERFSVLAVLMVFSLFMAVVSLIVVAIL